MCRSVILLVLLYSLSPAYGQDFMDLLQQVDSAADAARKSLGVPQGEPPSSRPQIEPAQGQPPATFDPERIGWHTLYLPYVRAQIPRTASYWLDLSDGSYLDFKAFLCHSPTSARVLLGVMSKEAFENEVLPMDLSRVCGDCESEPLPAKLHPELAARNGRYIAYQRRRDRMSLTAYGDVGQDSLFMLSVTAYHPKDFRKQVPEIFQYLLEQVEILDGYGPYGKAPTVEMQSQVVPLMTEDQASTWGPFDQKAETFLARQPDGDLIAGAVHGDDTYLQRYEGGDPTDPAGTVVRLGNHRLRDLIGTEQGYAGLFRQRTPEGNLMYLIHYDEKGRAIFRTKLIEQAMITGVGSATIWEGYDCQKLAQVGDRFLAYLSIQQKFDQPMEIASPCSRNGIHQGDVMLTIDAQGRIEYASRPDRAEQAQPSSSLGVGSPSTSQGQTMPSHPNPTHGFWWGMSHSFTKDLIVHQDYALYMAVGDVYPNKGLEIRRRDVTADPNPAPQTYCSFMELPDRTTKAQSMDGQNYVEGYMAGNLHADQEQIYYSFVRDPDGAKA